MKILKIFLVSSLLIFFSCSDTKKNQAESSDDSSTTKYDGPIIDMHVHAFAEGNPMFGLTHPPTLRGDTFEGVSSAREQKEKTLEMFQKHNIVKALVTNGTEWMDSLPETVLVWTGSGIAFLQNIFR